MVEIAFSMEELQRHSAEAGLSYNFIVKEAMLFAFLDILRNHPFVLKGGTAINKAFLGEKQRFSEDLDFDTEFSKIEVVGILKKEGFSTKDSYFTKHAFGFAVQYEFHGLKDVVKLEFTTKKGIRHEIISLKSAFLPLSITAKAYSFSDLVAQKEKAFLSREEWKDLYDLYWLAKLHPEKFRLKNSKETQQKIASMKISKTANSYIPLKNRINWEIIKQDFISMLNDSGE